MENILLRYMVERFNLEQDEKKKVVQLPFITISREFGCPAKDVATMIIERLNTEYEKTKNFIPWTTISKEVLMAASEELHIDQSKIKRVFNDEKRGVIDEILNAFSEKYYYSDRKILKTIDKVILDFAHKGNVVIVGRGGMAVTRELPLGLHVRLFAPISWRIQQLMDAGICKTMEEARKVSEQIDFKRNELLKSKSKTSYSYKDDFDVYYNCKYLSVEEITTSVINLLRIKKFI